MTARDRSQLRDRLATALAKSAPKPISFEKLAKHIEREVDRAVRAERKAFRDTEELRVAQVCRRAHRMKTVLPDRNGEPR